MSIPSPTSTGRLAEPRLTPYQEAKVYDPASARSNYSRPLRSSSVHPAPEEEPVATAISRPQTAATSRPSRWSARRPATAPARRLRVTSEESRQAWQALESRLKTPLEVQPRRRRPATAQAGRARPRPTPRSARSTPGTSSFTRYTGSPGYQPHDYSGVAVSPHRGARASSHDTLRPLSTASGRTLGELDETIPVGDELRVISPGYSGVSASPGPVPRRAAYEYDDPVNEVGYTQPPHTPTGWAPTPPVGMRQQRWSSRLMMQYYEAPDVKFGKPDPAAVAAHAVVPRAAPGASGEPVEYIGVDSASHTFRFYRPAPARGPARTLC
ncbi:uncharacterized protein AMSG_03142 [Thecamonas trahens ATCC 50062]|uniref:Uncharacterized protein n=1 Tax=Thecamonas trahens ATCC 50062 TaxID=461836 RepID=A0A0L0D3E3_THETB|nr:hypothetical protein AMSG_03142 [Thecamonas trahens ATCC 50062]KNC46705.1 hypothetical protein AMSG_03142 [Thecamonas trahens ATCC 50062]|eukprot:XP_013760471.1 hypothetical protein AMSG_03142 [Thecamonas trahens ATCC 50062]